MPMLLSLQVVLNFSMHIAFLFLEGIFLPQQRFFPRQNTSAINFFLSYRGAFKIQTIMKALTSQLDWKIN